jgi:hypothetical protein
MTYYLFLNNRAHVPYARGESLDDVRVAARRYLLTQNWVIREGPLVRAEVAHRLPIVEKAHDDTPDSQMGSLL